MNFKFRHVEIFWAIMTTGKTTAAAEMLNTSQPTISRELAQFEHATRLKLFDRNNGKLIPTESARLLFEEVKVSYFGLDRIKSTVESLRNFQQAQISLACLPAYSIALMPLACKYFCDRYPGASINVKPLETPYLEEALSAQRFHMGLIENGKAPPGTMIECLLDLDVVCVMPSGHPLSAKATLEPADFQGQDFVYLAAGDPYRIQIDSIFSNHGVERNMMVETHSADAVCATVRLGVGVALVNPLTALHYSGIGLVLRPFTPRVSYTVFAVKPLHRPPAPVVEPFLEALRTSCNQLTAELQSVLNKPQSLDSPRA